MGLARCPGPAKGQRRRNPWAAGATSGSARMVVPIAIGTSAVISTSTSESSASRPASAVCRHNRDSVGNAACWKIKPKVEQRRDHPVRRPYLPTSHHELMSPTTIRSAVLITACESWIRQTVRPR